MASRSLSTEFFRPRHPRAALLVVAVTSVSLALLLAVALGVIGL